MNQLCWPFCLPLVSDSCSQRLSFFSQKILVILMPSSDWGLELNVSLSTTSFFFLFSSTISFSLFLYAFLHFFLYFAFSFCHYDIVFILSLHFFFINTTSFIPSLFCWWWQPHSLQEVSDDASFSSRISKFIGYLSSWSLKIVARTHVMWKHRSISWKFDYFSNNSLARSLSKQIEQAHTAQYIIGQSQSINQP